MSNVLGADKFRLIVEISDSAFVFVNEFSSRHCSRLVLDIESPPYFGSSLREGKCLAARAALVLRCEPFKECLFSGLAVHRLLPIGTTLSLGLMMRCT